MKKLFFLLPVIALLTYSTGYSQVADGISYQAVALDDKGKEIAGHDINGLIIHSKEILVRFSILQDSQDGAILYSEEQSTYTDPYGMFNLIIGHGEVLTDGLYSSLLDIQWGKHILFLKVEIDIKGKGDFKVMGIQQMMAVPFAFHAFHSSETKNIEYSNIVNAPVLSNVALTGEFSDLRNTPSTLDGYGITDAMTNGHPANNITGTDITDWNTAYSWGDHAGLYRSIGYVPDWSEITSMPFHFSSPSNDQLIRFNSGTGQWENWSPNYLTSYTETDPVWTEVSANYYTKTDMQTGGAAELDFDNLTGKPTTLSGFGITDAMTTSHPANNITGTDITDWNSAYSWGDHAGLYRSIGYVPDWSEITSMPFSFNSPTNGQLARYNSGTGRWENWSPNYLTAYTETDPVWTAASANYFTIAQMQSPGGAQLSFENVINKPHTLAEYEIWDALDLGHPAASIDWMKISEWDIAYSWGDHAGLYRSIGYLPDWGEITSMPFSFSSPSNGQLIRYNSGTGRWENWSPNYLTAYTETDPVWTAASANYFTIAQMQSPGGAQLSFENVINKPHTLAEYEIWDALDMGHPAASIDWLKINEWDIAYSWGDHNAAGYEPGIPAGINTQYYRGDKTWQTLDKAAVGLDQVDNISLFAWPGSPSITILGTVFEGEWNAGPVHANGEVTGDLFRKWGGTSDEFLKADGSVDSNIYLTEIREAADEFTASAGQTSFTLSQPPAITAKVKMYINGIRISNSAYNHTGTTLTYDSANNGSYDLVAGDRVQFDYIY